MNPFQGNVYPMKALQSHTRKTGAPSTYPLLCTTILERTDRSYGAHRTYRHWASRHYLVIHFYKGSLRFLGHYSLIITNLDNHRT